MAETIAFSTARRRHDGARLAGRELTVFVDGDEVGQLEKLADCGAWKPDAEIERLIGDFGAATETEAKRIVRVRLWERYRLSVERRAAALIAEHNSLAGASPDEGEALPVFDPTAWKKGDGGPCIIKPKS